MRLDLFAFYGGPDQIMTMTSGVASVLGLLLIFWNKAVGLFFRVVRVFRPSHDSASSAPTTSSDKK